MSSPFLKIALATSALSTAWILIRKPVLDNKIPIIGKAVVYDGINTAVLAAATGSIAYQFLAKDM